MIASPQNANKYDEYGKASHQPLTISQKDTSYADTNLLIVKDSQRHANDVLSGSTKHY